MGAESEVEVLPVEDELTPLYEPVFRESGMLKVSDVHSISYKVYGNPKGKPVLCVHGGPGAGTGTGKVREQKGSAGEGNMNLTDDALCVCCYYFVGPLLHAQ